MTSKGQQPVAERPNKRKHPKSAASGGSPAKKPKLPPQKGNYGKKETTDSKHPKAKFGKPKPGPGDGPKTKRELRIQAKEVTEARKKKRRRHYTLEQDLTRLWEKMRQRNIAKEDRSKFISEALQKMKGKIPEIATSHVSSRVLQTCAKYCSPAEREAIFLELKPHFLNFACNTYAVHLVKKMLDGASKQQLTEFISFLRGHVATLLRHMVGSVVIEHVYQMGNASQKQELLMELYSTEFQLFKGLTAIKESRLLDVIHKFGLQKSSVLRHTTSVLQPVLEKGIVDHSIIHRVIVEYFSIADKSFAADTVKQLSSPLLVRMIHTKDGSRIGVLCIKHGTAKDRKKLVKGMKEHVVKMALDQYGSLVLSCLVATVDDTKLLTKVVIRELQANVKELVLDKNGRRPLLQLLHPNSARCFSPDDIATLNFSIPSLSSQFEVPSGTMPTDAKESSNPAPDTSREVAAATLDDRSASPENLPFTEGGKKDASIRRQELLINNGLAEKLIDVCRENAGELLRSNFGKDIIYEVATGGSGGILLTDLGDKLKALHEAIASLGSESKSEEPEKDHVLENFHSSRTIRKLVLDSPAFATTLWTTALQGKCASWAQGHSCKVVAAFLETSDPGVREISKKELKPLVDGGILKVRETLKS